MYAGMPDRRRTPSTGRRQKARPPPEEAFAERRWQRQRRFPTGWTFIIAGTCAAIAIQILIHLDGQIDFRPIAPRYTPYPALVSPFGTKTTLDDPAPSFEQHVLILGDPPARTAVISAEAIRISDIANEKEEGSPVASTRERMQCAAMLSAATTVRHWHRNAEDGTGELRLTPATPSGTPEMNRDNALRSIDRAKGADPAQSGYMDRCRLLIGLILMGASGHALQSRIPGF